MPSASAHCWASLASWSATRKLSIVIQGGYLVLHHLATRRWSWESAPGLRNARGGRRPTWPVSRRPVGCVSHTGQSAPNTGASGHVVHLVRTVQDGELTDLAEIGPELDLSSALGGTRTPNLLIRSQWPRVRTAREAREAREARNYRGNPPVTTVIPRIPRTIEDKIEDSSRRRVGNPEGGGAVHQHSASPIARKWHERWCDDRGRCPWRDGIGYSRMK